MKTTSEANALILAAIRGEIPISALADIGINVVCEAGSCKLESEMVPTVVTPTVLDIASGLLKYKSSTPELRLWSFFVLAESGSVDLAKVESDPQGDLLINALWDASQDGKLTDNIVDAAENLVSGILNRTSR
jgi:hypothetical protein